MQPSPGPDCRLSLQRETPCRDPVLGPRSPPTPIRAQGAGGGTSICPPPLNLCLPVCPNAGCVHTSSKVGTEAIIQTVYFKTRRINHQVQLFETCPKSVVAGLLSPRGCHSRLTLSHPLSLLVTLVQLLQLRPPQREGLERGICGAGGRVPPRGQRALQRPAGEHDPEQRAAAHQCLQQRCPPDPPTPGANRAPGSGESECGCGWHRCRLRAFKCVLVCARMFSR